MTFAPPSFSAASPPSAIVSSCSGGIFDAPALTERLAELDHLSAQQSFWDDPDAANGLLQERAGIKKKLDGIEAILALLDDGEVMCDMAVEEDDLDTFNEANAAVNKAERTLAAMELERMLGGPHDRSNCFISVNAGAGGTESQDWASMLLRMLTRYCEKRGYKTEITEYQDGAEAGLSRATIRIEGDYAFGYLKAENGVHRLVRISPFDSANRRHTSFASVEVMPEIDDDILIEINPANLTMETFRASGAGGQHVNKTNSAVRLRYAQEDGTEVIVECQAERSQHKNRATAEKLLRTRMYQAELAKRGEERDALYAGKAKIDFGSQIRSYVLQPYQMVKDLRTRHESSNPQAVLDGDLDGFMAATLAMGVDGKSRADAQGD